MGRRGQTPHTRCKNAGEVKVPKGRYAPFVVCVCVLRRVCVCVGVEHVILGIPMDVTYSYTAAIYGVGAVLFTWLVCELTGFKPFKSAGRGVLSISSGSAARQGVRPTMEDAHVQFNSISQDLGHEESIQLGVWESHGVAAYYGVYDGHVGDKASAITAKELHRYALSDGDFASGDVCSALHNAFVSFDESLCARATEERFKDGTTAAVAIVLDTKVFSANVGDSEVLLARSTTATSTGPLEPMVLSEIHKPTKKEERARIEAQGGFVLGGRVSGLAVSRALGDVWLKTTVEEEEFKCGPLLTAAPYTKETELMPYKDAFMIVACDGLWEELTHQESIDFVSEQLETGKSLDEISGALADHAIAKGSRDNVSVILIKFDWN